MQFCRTFYEDSVTFMVLDNPAVERVKIFHKISMSTAYGLLFELGIFSLHISQLVDTNTRAHSVFSEHFYNVANILIKVDGNYFL